MVKILGFLTFFSWGLDYKGAGDSQFWIIWHREETHSLDFTM